MIRRSRINRVIFFLASVSSAALIISILASVIDPQTFILPAFFGLAFPFIFLIHLVISILCIILSQSKKALLFLVPVLASAGVFINSFGINFFTSSPGEPKSSFDFMTYNVHNFGDRVDLGVSIKPQVVEIVKEENPSILCMQDFFSPPRKFNVVDTLKKAMQSPNCYTGPDSVKLFPRSCLAIFSKFPIVNQGYIRLSNAASGNQCIYVDVKKDNKIFRIYNVHLQSLKFQKEDFVKWDKGTRNKISFLTHNIRRLHYAFLERSKQVHIMKKEIATCTIPFIIAGDFNDSPSSYAVNEMCRGLKNSFREKGTGYQVTYNGDLPNFQIDYVMTKPDFKINTYKVIQKKLSDHYGVTVNLSL